MAWALARTIHRASHHRARYRGLCLGALALIAMTGGMTGCKKKSNYDLIEGDGYKLQAFQDPDYLLFLTHAALYRNDFHEDDFIFMMCKHHKKRSRSRPSQPGKVLQHSCIPAFKGIDGEPLRLSLGAITQDHQAMARHSLKTKSYTTHREQGRLQIAAFGFGSMFSGFHKPYGDAWMKLTPGTQKWPKLAMVSEFGFEVGTFMTPLGVSDEVLMNRVLDMDHYRTLYPKEPVKYKADDIALAGASAVSGYAVARFVMTSAAVVAGGPALAIGAYLVFPFITAVILEALPDHDGDLLNHFDEILRVSDPHGDVLNQAALIKSVPRATEALGKTLLEVGWVTQLSLHSYCIPDYYGKEECHKIEYSKKYLQNLRTEHDRLASLPDTCTFDTTPSKIPTDTSFFHWEGYLNCRFMEGGECAKNYECGILFKDVAGCKRLGRHIQDRRASLRKTPELKDSSINQICHAWVRDNDM